MIYNKMIYNKIIIVCFVIFQATFFVGCRRPGECPGNQQKEIIEKQTVIKQKIKVVANVTEKTPFQKKEIVEKPVFELRGKVVGEDNLPIDGAVVCAKLWKRNNIFDSSITDKDGLFLLSLNNKFTNFWSYKQIIASKAGYSETIDDFEEFVSITLQRGGHITGKVMTAEGNSLSGIVMYASGRFDSAYKSLPTDANGIYIISNVYAPKKYEFWINDTNEVYSLPHCYRDKNHLLTVEQNETSEYNLIAEKSGVLAIKVYDIYGIPILNYEINGEIEINKGFAISIRQKIDFSENKWFCFQPHSFYAGNGTFSCKIDSKLKAGSWLGINTNNIPFLGNITNYITLYLSDFEPNLTGYVFKPDGSPAAKTIISVWSPTFMEMGKFLVDNQGYFEVKWINTKKDELLIVDAKSHNDPFILRTNLVSRSKNVELKLFEPCSVKGHVINQNEKLIKAEVFLESKETAKKIENFSYRKSGNYSFEKIMPGKYVVFARSFGFIVSNSFSISEGEELELPDLVINYTNAAFVTITFILPSGNVLKYPRIGIKKHYHDNKGRLNMVLQSRTYSGCLIEHSGKRYIADDFEVTEMTDKLEVWLREQTK